MNARRLGWIALPLVIAVALVIGLTDDSGPVTKEDRVQRISETLMCPTCRGQSVADSDSSASRDIRRLIEEKVDEGLDDNQVRDQVAQRFGEGVLLTPERSGLAGLVWVLPVAGVVVAGAGIGWTFWRWRRRKVALHASDSDRELVAQAMGDPT